MKTLQTKFEFHPANDNMSSLLNTYLVTIVVIFQTYRQGKQKKKSNPKPLIIIFLGKALMDSSEWLLGLLIKVKR